jgi:hypothetical protein
MNFARRTECNRCETARPEGYGPPPGSGKNGPPSGGLFKPGDWTCNTYVPLFFNNI